MSPSKAIGASPVAQWTVDGSTVARVAGTLEQVNVSNLPGGKVLRIETSAGAQSVTLDQAAARHVAALLVRRKYGRHRRGGECR